MTEFHGEFDDAKLPPRSKLFSGRGLDVLQSKRGPFEDYLKKLLQKPALKGSDILFTFLTSSEELTADAYNLGLGKLIKNVPMKLTKERGQSLQPFISSFVASTLQGPPQPSYDAVVGAECDEQKSERPILPHEVFQNNLALSNGVKLGHCNKYFANMKRRQEEGVYDTLVYLAVKVFQVTGAKLQIMMGLRTLFRNTFDSLVEYVISSKLAQVLSVGRMVHLCQLVEGAIFEAGPSRTDADKLARKKKALENMQSFLRPLLEGVVGKEMFEERTEMIFSSIQNPTINKQLAYVLVDTALVELFPELKEG